MVALQVSEAMKICKPVSSGQRLKRALHPVRPAPTRFQDLSRYEVQIEAQGSLFQMKVKADPLAEDGGLEPKAAPPKRGQVSRFTRASRLRLIRSLNRLDARAALAVRPAVFLTLTYGASFPTPQVAKRHLRAFWARLQRLFPEAAAIWRLEPQERGAPHFHLVVFNLPFLHWERLRLWWEQVTGFVPYRTADGRLVEHLRPKIEAITSWRRLASYVCKYCAKVDEGKGGKRQDGFLVNESYLHAGRFWGLFNKQRLPWAALVSRVFRGGLWMWMVKRVGRHLYRRLGKLNPGFTVFVNRPGEVLRWAESCAGVAAG